MGCVPTSLSLCWCGGAGGALGLQLQPKSSPPSWECKRGSLGCVCCTAVCAALLCCSAVHAAVLWVARLAQLAVSCCVLLMPLWDTASPASSLDKCTVTPFARSCLHAQHSHLC